MKNDITITFKNKEDFRKRIANLWQTQKKDEIYNFFFLDKDVEEEFESLVSCFVEGQQGARL